MQTMLGVELPLLAGLVLLIALTAYMVFGGADFGGGIWDLLASGPRRDQQRQFISKAIGPVWEANHVWLIFVAVILFTAFPRAFAALAVGLFTPLRLVLVGIILRGAAYIFRTHHDVATSDWRTWSWIFGAASTITPFILGATLIAVSSGGIRVIDGQVTVDPAVAWLNPVSLLVGLLSLAIFSYLAAVYLCVETEGPLQDDFRTNALRAWVAVAILPAIILPLMPTQAPLLWEHFARWESVPPMALGILCAVISGWAVWVRRFRVARAFAIAEVVILLWGWAMAQWPYIIYPDMTAYNSAAPALAIRFLLQTLPFGFGILIPSLWFLFRVFKGKAEKVY